MTSLASSLQASDTRSTHHHISIVSWLRLRAQSDRGTQLKLSCACLHLANPPDPERPTKLYFGRMRVRFKSGKSLQAPAGRFLSSVGRI